VLVYSFLRPGRCQVEDACIWDDISALLCDMQYVCEDMTYTDHHGVEIRQDVCMESYFLGCPHEKSIMFAISRYWEWSVQNFVLWDAQKISKYKETKEFYSEILFHKQINFPIYFGPKVIISAGLNQVSVRTKKAC
jgi:hypothetical protein